MVVLRNIKSPGEAGTSRSTAQRSKPLSNPKSSSFVPPGYCQCGCGQQTPIYKSHAPGKGRIKGQRARFLVGHTSKYTSHKVRVTCAFCGKQRLRPPSQVQTTNYCSMQCKDADQRGTSRPVPQALILEYRRWWDENAPEDAPYGYCWCGCGEKTKLASATAVMYNRLKGEPIRHVGKHRRSTPENYHELQDHGYDTPCWIWQGAVNGDGYPVCSHDLQKSRFVYRLNYERKYGPLPQGYEIHHKCRVRPCVNPDHLLPVTHKQNNRLNPHVKLTEAKASEIRRLRENTGASYASIAQTFGVSRGTIAKVIQGRTWT